MKKGKPNNFPREGQNNTVTRAMLDKLEADRPQHNKTLDYTIGGTTETQVHSSVEAERNYALKAGHKRLGEVSKTLQTDHVFSANKGRAKAHMNHAANNTTTYAQRQREIAKKKRAKVKGRTR